jgi:hypothetical protein
MSGSNSVIVKDVLARQQQRPGDGLAAAALERILTLESRLLMAIFAATELEAVGAKRAYERAVEARAEAEATLATARAEAAASAKVDADAEKRASTAPLLIVHRSLFKPPELDFSLSDDVRKRDRKLYGPVTFCQRATDPPEVFVEHMRERDERRAKLGQGDYDIQSGTGRKALADARARTSLFEDAQLGGKSRRTYRKANRRKSRKSRRRRKSKKC